jgi:hypothetical protein
VASLFDPRGADDVQPRIPLCGPNGFPSVDTDAHLHGPARWPRLGREGTLNLYRGGDRLGGTEEHHEERVALGIDFSALIGGEGSGCSAFLGGSDSN